jgi:large subunit ribosomal protein L17
LAISLVEHERLETTVAKAKELRRVADRLVTWGKEGSLNSRRLAQSVLQRHGLVVKLFNEIAPRLNDRAGGYTRIIKTRYRAGDNAPMAMIELTCAKPPEPRQGTVRKAADEAEGAQPAAKEKKAKVKTAGGKA